MKKHRLITAALILLVSAAIAVPAAAQMPDRQFPDARGAGQRMGGRFGPQFTLEQHEQIEKIHSHSVTCATSFVQKAGVTALTGPQEFIGEMVSAWDRRRRAVTAGLSAINGITCPLVEGAFYAFADIRGTGMTSSEAADLFLQQAHVAVTPGIAFGEAGEGHVRLSFATGDEQLAAAVDRIGAVLGLRPV